MSTKISAVIFDLGGVVLPSPMQAFYTLEEKHGLERNFINRMIGNNGEASAWSKLEKGFLSLNDEFFDIFDQEIADAGAPGFSSRELMSMVSDNFEPNAHMVQAIKTIKESGLKVAALTNNWKEPDNDGFAAPLYSFFDEVIESAVVGLQKPDPRIYQLACEKLNIDANEAVFLDDIGRNLKSAKALGMTTIKVVDPIEALKELESILNISLL